MVDFSGVGVVDEDSTGVVEELLSNSHSADNWSSLVDFVHHLGFSRDLSVLANTVDLGVGLSPAARGWGAVLAFDD